MKKLIALLVFIVTLKNANSQSCNQGECGPIRSLDYEIVGGEIVFTWEPPVEAEQPNLCNSLYFINFIVNGEEVFNNYHRDVTITFDIEACSYFELTVYSLSPGAIQTCVVSMDGRSKMTGDGKVENLQTTDTEVTWDRPQVSPRCNLNYSVKYKSEIDELTIRTDATSAPLPNVVSCSEYEITVTAYNMENSEEEGEPSSIQYTVPPYRLPPVHVFTDPTGDGAFVKWTVETEQTLCTIDSIEFSYKLNGETDYTIFSTRPFDELTDAYVDENLSGLPRDVEVFYHATWILAGGRSEPSLDVLFVTTPLTPSEISEPTFIEPVPNELAVEIGWLVSYDERFVTGHRVEVRNEGADHDLPEHCETNEGNVEYEDEASYPEVNSVSFYNARYSFKYSVIVTTVFGTLGVVMSSLKNFITPIGVPVSPEEIFSRHTYTPDEAYGVNTEIEWATSCDINGPLLGYDYKIVGKLVRDETACEVVILEETVPPTLPDANYSVVVDKKLFPVFKYDFTITTRINKDGNDLNSEIVEELEDLPPAYVH